MIMQGLEDLKASDLLLEPGRWNEEFIYHILSPIEAPIVCGQLLSRLQEHDFPIWHHSSSGLYMVKSCYDMLLSLNGLPSAGFSEAWKRFWKLPLPPKVLDFVWRLCINCLPLRVRLHQKGVVSVTCKSVVLPFCCSVKEVEAAGIREGLQWLLELHHFEVDVELDAKIVVDAFYSEPLVIGEFRCIIDNCRGFIANSYFSIQFVKRQMNGRAHCLVRVARSHVSPLFRFLFLLF